MKTRRAGWVPGVLLAFGLVVAGCAAGGDGTTSTSGGKGTKSHVDSGSSGDDSTGDDTTPSGDDDTTPTGDDTTSTPSGDDASPVESDGGPSTPGNPFPPISLPEAGASMAPDPSCAAKICFDFFDCLLQGCATACTGLKCM